MAISDESGDRSAKISGTGQNMKNEKVDVIAIDGPAGSGKSTTARLVAQKLGFTYLDTGAMYRAVTLKSLRQGLDLENEAELSSLVSTTKIELCHSKGRLKITLDDENVTHKLRSQNVNLCVPKVAAMPVVRKWMVRLQHNMGAKGKLVAEGRDIGTVVFPNARLKIYLVASIEARAKRRAKDFFQASSKINLNNVIEELKSRDQIDCTRETAPLRKADDAIELDTTNLTIEQQVDFIVKQWNKNTENQDKM
ncbi:MAG: (d)CMP kinase [bacterium]|nr:(d)CMP kinase [bacterium]